MLMVRREPHHTPRTLLTGLLLTTLGLAFIGGCASRDKNVAPDTKADAKPGMPGATGNDVRPEDQRTAGENKPATATKPARDEAGAPSPAMDASAQPAAKTMPPVAGPRGSSSAPSISAPSAVDHWLFSVSTPAETRLTTVNRSANFNDGDNRNRQAGSGGGPQTSPAEPSAQQPTTPAQVARTQALGVVVPTPTALPALPGLLPSKAEDIWIIERPAQRSPSDNATAPRSGCLLARDATGTPLRLVSTDINSRIDGCISSVTYAQQFISTLTSPTDAVYILPLPDDAAVYDFVLKLGDRQIRGVIRERAEAQRLYNLAAATGHRAAITQANADNTFAAPIAGIAPGAAVGAEITYFQVLPYEAGEFILRVPLTQTTLNPSAGEPAVSLNIRIDAAVPIESLRSTSHEIEILPSNPEKFNAQNRNIVRLKTAAGAMKRDFELRYKVASSDFRPGFTTYTDGEGTTYYAALFIPPIAHNESSQRRPIEWCLVVDKSAAVSADQWELTKKSLIELFNRIEQDDRVKIFFTGQEAAWPRFDGFGVGNPTAKKSLPTFLETLKPGGADLLVEPLKQAMNFEGASALERITVVFSPGRTSDAADVLAEVQNKLKFNRIVTVAPGADADREYLTTLARCGRGAAIRISTAEDAPSLIEQFFTSAVQPILFDIGIGYNQTKGQDLYPRRPHDVMLDRPSLITGRYVGVPPSILSVTGRAGPDVKFTLLNPLVTDGVAGNPAIARVWARRRMQDLATWATSATLPTLDDDIRETSRRWTINSPYTALLAVDATK